MLYKVQGVQDVNYTNKEGREVRGTNIHCTYEHKSITGMAVEKIYVSARIDVPILKQGDDIDVSYNKFGSVENVSLV